ncbi:MAG: GGDEF domain-containing protein [Desulfuromonadaceae bacterium]
MSKLEELNKDNLKLPSPPAIAVRILQVVRQDDSSFAALAQIISADPALTAKMLQVANSAIYALPNKVNTIEKALSVIGVDVLKNIALSFVIAKEMRGGGGDGFDFEYFWKKSVTSAVAAELLCGLLGYRLNDLFVSALLQDIGVLVMYLCRPLEYLQVLDEKKATGVDIEIVERRVFGFDHQEIGADLLREWGLPENIHGPIRYHHGADSCPEELRLSADLLRWSALLASVYHGSHSAERVRTLKRELVEKFNIETERIDAMVDSVAEKCVDILSCFEIDPGNMRPFSQLLQEANEELGRLNLTYEQLVMEYKQAKEKAERLAGELQAANSKLRELAFRDGLTGLYNHRYFQELMAREMSRAVRHDGALSLMMFDIDHFKRINDSHGHPGGDLILRQLATLVQDCMRISDVVARYGGEEFAVILPMTGAVGAKVFAERLRRKVEQMVTDIEGQSVRITVSIGLTTYEPGMMSNDKVQLIDAADRALYHSKKHGRNQVSVAALK